MNIELPQIRITPPDLTEANEALAKMAEHLRGVRVYTATEIESIKADAYDEGFTACAREHAKQHRDPNYPITRTNPYTSNA